MQMIDVLKRLAELDASNPNIVKESMTPKDMEECGDDMMANEPSQSNGPVSVNISANSGEELGDMLSAIMQLAGVHKVGDEHMGVEPPASVLTAEPNMHKDAHGVDDMRAVLDQMNGASGEEETDESAASDETDSYGIPGVDTTPANPHKQLPFDPNEFSQNTNDGDGDRANGHPRLTTQPTATYESLMAEYKKFVTESTLKESSYEDILKHFPKQVQDFKNGGELDYDLESALWDYHFNNGDIINYDADASEYIGQNLADYLGVDENMERESVDAEHRRGLEKSAEADGRLKSGGQTNEDAGDSEIGQMMANDGITYSPEKENELINLMAQYMKKSGMSSKAIRYYLSYDEDYISDQLGLLPREG